MGKPPLTPKDTLKKDSSSANLNKERLRKTIKEARRACQKVKDQHGLPGLSVAVSVNGKVVWQEGLGYADLENGLEMKPESVMRIASISKSMTMAMLAQLMEQGRVDIEAPIQKYIPTFPRKTFQGQNVVISTRHLLSHLSGIRHYKKKSEADKEKAKKEKADKNKTKEEGMDGSEKEFFMKECCPDLEKAMELFKNDELFHKPGSVYLYSTHGWTLVSAVIEKVTLTPFPKYARKMFDLWGLKNTYLDEHEPLIYNRARYYVKDSKGRLVNAPYVDNSCKWAGGGFLSNVQDLLQFGNIMLYSKQCKDAKKQKTHPFLKSSTISEVWKGNEVTRTDPDQVGLYALGFTVVDPFRKCMFCKEGRMTRVGHSGGAVGASSNLLISFNPNHSIEDEEEGPKGVVVAMITNLIDIGFGATITHIADLFTWMV